MQALVLLHGTGGDAEQMLELGRELASQAHLLAIQGNVMENGYARYFKRQSEGVYDLDDLKQRTEDLNYFLKSALRQHQLETKETYLIGFSNGANMAISLALNYPDLIDGLVLLRPLYPHQPSSPPDLRGKNILLIAGQHDPLASQQQTQDLMKMLQSFDANVTAHFIATDHQLSEMDISLTQQWLGANI